MDIDQLKTLWQTCDQKLDKAITLNHQCMQEININKLNSNLLMFKALTWIGLLSAVAWIIFIGWLALSLSNYTGFVISAGAIILVAAIGIANYIRQLYLVSRFDYAQGISIAQEKLAMTELSLLKNTRIMFLQLPFYSTFYLSADLLTNADPFWLTFQIIVTGALTFAAIWLYLNISPRNLHKQWVKKLLDGVGMKTLQKAMGFLKEVQDFKHA